MFKVIEEFIDVAQKAESQAALSEEFGRAIAELGFTRFCAWCLADQSTVPEDAVKLLQYQEGWIEYYREREFWRVDPTLRMGRERSTPFLWTDVATDPEISLKERRFMLEASDAGLRYGLTVPVMGVAVPPGNVTVYSEDVDFGPASKHALHLMSIYLYETVCRILNESEAGQLYAIPEALTQRERECLKWAAMGKTDWEIGEILAVSQATAHFHIENAKRKFGVATRTQAVVRAVVTNQIVP